MDVTDRNQFPALVASSHERPLLLVLHLSGDSASAQAMQALGESLQATPDGFRLALVRTTAPFACRVAPADGFPSHLDVSPRAG